MHILLHSRRKFYKAAQLLLSLDDVLSKMVDHHNHVKQIGPDSSAADKQSDGNDNEKKGDTSAVANPAIRDWDGAASSVKCLLS